MFLLFSGSFAFLGVPSAAQQNDAQQNCDPAYAGVCIAPPPPDLDCGDLSSRNFRVYLPGDTDLPNDLTVFDPHRFDGDKDGIGCES